jgi:hypothetical protein
MHDSIQTENQVIQLSNRKKNHLGIRKGEHIDCILVYLVFLVGGSLTPFCSGFWLNLQPSACHTRVV